MKKLNSRGFGHLEVLTLVFVIFVVVGVGFYVSSKIQDRSSKAENAEITEVARLPKETAIVRNKAFDKKVDIRVGIEEAGQAVPEATNCANGPGTSGARVQIVYVTKRSNDTFAEDVSTLRRIGAGIDQIYMDSATKTGGKRQVKWTRNDQCKILVQKLVIDDDKFYATFQEGKENPQATKRILKQSGLNRNDRKYLVYVNYQPEGRLINCGVNTRSRQDSRPGKENLNNTTSTIQVIAKFCWNYPSSYFYSVDLVSMSLGAQQATAPHAMKENGVFNGMFTDAWGLLSPAIPGTPTACANEFVDKFLLDCNNDDYFYAGTPPVGNYLKDHWNIANSKFLFTPDN